MWLLDKKKTVVLQWIYVVLQMRYENIHFSALKIRFFLTEELAAYKNTSPYCS
jgi:hypothetical protein